MLICPFTKKCKFIVPGTKNSHPSHPYFAPLWPRAQNFNTWDLTSEHTPVKFYPNPLRFAGVIRHIIPSRYIESLCTIGSYAAKNIKLLLIWSKYMCLTAYRPTIRYFTAISKVTTGKLPQNCYFCLIQKTISNSILWLLDIKYFWPGCFAPPYLLRPVATAPLCPPLLRHWNHVLDGVHMC